MRMEYLTRATMDSGCVTFSVCTCVCGCVCCFNLHINAEHTLTCMQAECLWAGLRCALWPLMLVTKIA